MKKLCVIHVGCSPFGLGRLTAALRTNSFEIVACVDAAGKKVLPLMETMLPDGAAQQLGECLYSSLEEAVRAHPADACLIYSATGTHTQLSIESLQRGLHTLCVKPVADHRVDFEHLWAVRRTRPDLIYMQGQNKRWNPGSVRMQQWMRERIGTFLGGECRFWIHQSMIRNGERFTVETMDGSFFHIAACHQLDQLVVTQGLPKYVTARIHQRQAPEMGYSDAWGAAGGQAILEYSNGAVFTYIGSRAAHANQYDWSGHWTIHGSEADITRELGHLRLHQNGKCIEDAPLEDYDQQGIIKDDQIQFERFADAVLTGNNREWLETTALKTWALMEACNQSARSSERVDVEEFYQNLMNRPEQHS